MSAGYDELKLDEESSLLTAFETKLYCYRWLRPKSKKKTGQPMAPFSCLNDIVR